MPTEPVRDSIREEDDALRVSLEVLEAIDGLTEGHTATKDEIESVLKF